MIKILKIGAIIIVFLLIAFLIWQLKFNKTSLGFRSSHFKINELKAEEKPFVWDKIAPLTPDLPTDKDGILVYADVYYQPVQIADQGLFYLDTFHKTNNLQYLSLAQKYAQKLISLGVTSQDALYFNYMFDFELHGIKDQVIKAPWNSGMAQGEALSLFVRLYQQTNEKEYLEASQKTFKSFLNLKSESDPWTVFVDESNYYWIEEYAKDNDSPERVLNGFIYGLYGVYDYYELTKDIESKNILDASLTTLKQYLPEFRDPGNVSFYCLRHKRQSKSYHIIHTKQLNMLYKMTGDEYFKDMADNFYQDYH